LGLVYLLTALVARDAHALCRGTSDRSPEFDAGCPTTGQPLYWKSECVGIHMSEAASSHLTLGQAQALMTEGFAAWTTAGGACVPSINVFPLTPTADAKVDYVRGGTNENDVLFRDDDWPYAGPTSTLELVTTSFDASTGELLDADVEFNGTRIPAILTGDTVQVTDPTQSNGLRLLFIHAAGHFLGFGHSKDPTSIMYSELAVGDTRLPALSADDARGMCAAYPPDGIRPTLDAMGQPLDVQGTECTLSATAPTTASPCSGSSLHLDHGCSIGGARAPRGGPSMLFGATLALFAARARRRRST
jgi:hypothetical protein